MQTGNLAKRNLAKWEGFGSQVSALVLNLTKGVWVLHGNNHSVQSGGATPRGWYSFPGPRPEALYRVGLSFLHFFEGEMATVWRFLLAKSAEGPVYDIVRLS